MKDIIGEIKGGDKGVKEHLYTYWWGKNRRDIIREIKGGD